MDCVYYRCPPKVLIPFRKIADKSPYVFRYLYYLIGNYVAQWELRKILKYKSVVCDWYVYSTVAYHSVLLKRDLTIPSILLPDLLIYLEADMNEVASRLNKRTVVSKFENINFLSDVKKKYSKRLLNIQNKYIIDTSSKPIGTTLQEILQKIAFNN